MKMSDNISELAKALAQAQKELKNPENSADNPFFKSKYAPLDAVLNLVRPILAKYGISIIQSPVSDDKRIGVETMMLHESGQYIIGDPYLLTPTKTDPQSAGGAISYTRRYALNAILGISGEDDDDGNNASTPPGSKDRRRKSDICAVCGKKIDGITGKSGNPIPANEVAKISMSRYGEPLCAKCMEARKHAENS